jgi:hypothetical protein
VCRGWGSAPPDPVSPVHPDGTICRACGNPGSPGDPVVSDSQIHRSHVLEAQARYQDDLARRREAGASAIDDAVIGADHDYQGEFDPFPEPEDGNWPTGLPHRRNGDGTAAMPTAFMTAGELENYRRTGEFAAGAQPSPTPPATNGGSTVSTTVFDGALEGADTPHEAMQQAFQAFGASAAKIAQSASDDLAAAAAVHGMDRDPQTMADIAEIADQAAAVQARAQQAASGLASRHADGAEYHGTGTDAHASAFRPS